MDFEETPMITLKRTALFPLLALGLGLCSATSFAQTSAYAGFSTLGINAGYKHSFSNQFGMRMGINALNYSDTFNEKGTAYKGDLKMKSVELLADWHPLRNGLALTAGILLNDNTFKGKAHQDMAGTVSVNGVNYYGVNARAEVSGKLGSGVTPYLGIGYQANPAHFRGLGLSLGLGVVFQNPEVSLTVSGVSDPQGTLEENRLAAEQGLKKDMDKLKIYPVFSVGASYAF
jgi:opacity protein-like surface antigen